MSRVVWVWGRLFNLRRIGNPPAGTAGQAANPLSRAVLCSLAALAAAVVAADRPDRDARFFDAKVAPILTRRCLGCHNEHLKNGFISFLDRDSLLNGSIRGPAIVPGKPELGLMVAALRHDGEIQMPPGPKLPRKEIKVLTEWIQRGAVWGTMLQRGK